MNAFKGDEKELMEQRNDHGQNFRGRNFFANKLFTNFILYKGFRSREGLFNAFDMKI